MDITEILMSGYIIALLIWAIHDTAMDIKDILDRHKEDSEK